ncbi:uncharacterized protein Dwil_GK24223 [Drosophila willistoni]|uniref:Nudix hydrolase domain-containing protein n=2 Tax=Drosophila willistoni TaxID=7260 RepID=B4N166_DROWI|nr:acyl-coenzyme A diphosphatase NUDT19 isoform X1 [Drosophila willistoni]EDW78048.2 uncharacterized protein Dwil_GK24223 [Drosophila willistoni]
MSNLQTTEKWRPSASLILVAKSKSVGTNYNLLMLKRSDRTAIMPNQTVFPGGLLDTEADETVAWLQYFDEFGIKEEALRQLVLIHDNRPNILAPQGTGCYDRFFKRTSIWAREIILRLTALRECFEEVGILLCRNRNNLDYGQVAQYENVPDLEYWQQRVHNKPSEFLELCRTLKVVPDLWALYEWSAWASPATVGKRHETVFFIAFVDTQPTLLSEPSEVKQTMWLTPLEFLRLARLNEIWFLPPQVYELSRLLTIKDYESLLEFSKQRSRLGTTMFMPVAYVCGEAMVCVLPGDDFYVKESHLATEYIEFPGTSEEFRARAKLVHRYDLFGPAALNVELNFPPPNGHLKPQNLPKDLLKL